MNSLDPRVVRLPQPESADAFQTKQFDQLPTYEVFVQAKEGKQFQHEGIVHAPDLEMAFILAKESLTRRFQCISIFVTDTGNVFSSEITEDNKNAYDTIAEVNSASSDKLKYEVFHLLKRGKQHIHAGTVDADGKEAAFAMAKKIFGGIKVFNVWIIPASLIRYTSAEEIDFWKTLPEKRFRDAGEYKGGEKLKEFLGRKSPS